MKAMLYCLHCREETEHTITYEGNTIKSIKCEKCGTEIEINKENAKKNYTEEFLDRVLTKPQRMTEELQKDIGSFLFSLPVRIITKPYRILEEVKIKIKKGDE
ncbi:MAG: bh protein [Thermoanaerobacteraceae bacterium]